jgi:hypothetical protein
VDLISLKILLKEMRYLVLPINFFISGGAMNVNAGASFPLRSKMFISSSNFNVKSNGEITASAIRAEFGDLGSFALTLDAISNRPAPGAGMEKILYKWSSRI